MASPLLKPSDPEWLWDTTVCFLTSADALKGWFEDALEPILGLNSLDPAAPPKLVLGGCYLAVVVLLPNGVCTFWLDFGPLISLVIRVGFLAKLG